MFIKFKRRKASVLLVSIIALQLTVGCLLIKVNDFQNDIKVIKEIDKYYQERINFILEK